LNLEHIVKEQILSRVWAPFDGGMSGDVKEWVLMEKAWVLDWETSRH